MNSFKIVMIAMTALTATASYADGFTCEQTDGSLNVKVYNNTQAGSGTRKAAIMVISDNSGTVGNKTIARFTNVNGTLASSGATYNADVDLRFNDSNRKDADIAGTKLGEVDAFTLDIAFSYASPIENGAQTPGTLIIAKRDGDQVKIELECTRYLKN